MAFGLCPLPWAWLRLWVYGSQCLLSCLSTPKQKAIYLHRPTAEQNSNNHKMLGMLVPPNGFNHILGLNLTGGDMFALHDPGTGCASTRTSRPYECHGLPGLSSSLRLVSEFSSCQRAGLFVGRRESNPHAYTLFTPIPTPCGQLPVCPSFRAVIPKSLTCYLTGSKYGGFLRLLVAYFVQHLFAYLQHLLLHFDLKKVQYIQHAVCTSSLHIPINDVILQMFYSMRQIIL